MTHRALLALPALLWIAACGVPTDLGRPCVLVKRAAATTLPDGGVVAAADGGTAFITEGEIQAGKDFISFGATECEDLVCVRDSTTERPANAKDTDPANGYCSKPCAQGSTRSCPAADPAHDKNAALRLTCRPLLLDTETLALICQDKATCDRYFGGTTSPYFCARGTPAATQ